MPVACGNLHTAESLLSHLLHEGTQPVAIIRSLLRHFQRLEFALAHIASGQSPEQALAQLRPPVFFKYAPQARRALSLWDARALTQALQLFMRTERELKTGVLAPGAYRRPCASAGRAYGGGVMVKVFQA